MPFLLAVLLSSVLSQAQQAPFRWDQVTEKFELGISAINKTPVFVLPNQAKTQESGILLKTAQIVSSKFQENPDDLGKIFHESFLKKVSEEQAKVIFKDFYTRYGSVKSISILKQESEFQGEFSFSFDKGARIKVILALSKKSPYLITGLLLRNPTLGLKNLNEVTTEIKKLPGSVNFQLAKLGAKTEILAELNPDKALAIGSTFKLYILGSLLLENKNWNEIVHLRKENMSWPSGNLHTWPVGSPFTVHTLAAKMISESDNTATDHLLHYLGRETVEKNLKTLGNQNLDAAIPFLYTLEMFKIKGDENLIASYEKANLDGKIKFLKDVVAAIPRENAGDYNEPTAIETIEWFASASDLVRLMDWVRRQKSETALKILSINPGLDVPKETFEYVGFKGGSEPGVLNLTYLLRSKRGEYYALTASWNNPKQEVDAVKLIELLQTTVYLIEP